MIVFYSKFPSVNSLLKLKTNKVVIIQRVCICAHLSGVDVRDVAYISLFYGVTNDGTFDIQPPINANRLESESLDYFARESSGVHI